MWNLEFLSINNFEITESELQANYMSPNWRSNHCRNKEVLTIAEAGNNNKKEIVIESPTAVSQAKRMFKYIYTHTHKLSCN